VIDILRLLAVRRGTHAGHIDDRTAATGKSSVPINHDSGEVQAAGAFEAGLDTDDNPRQEPNAVALSPGRDEDHEAIVPSGKVRCS
jgi:hypothetical protein